jgi:GNAT superfamily N-acetyltransferase
LQEASTLHDTAKTVFAAPREPSLREFTPIGHVALEKHSVHEDAKLGLPSEGVVWMHILYVSYALQGGGLGSATMDQIERVAAQAPVKAKLVVLDTVQKEMAGDGALFRSQGFKPPAVSDSFQSKPARFC